MKTIDLTGVRTTTVVTKGTSDNANISVTINKEGMIRLEVNENKLLETLIFRDKIVGLVHMKLKSLLQDHLKKQDKLEKSLK